MLLYIMYMYTSILHEHAYIVDMLASQFGLYMCTYYSLHPTDLTDANVVPEGGVVQWSVTVFIGTVWLCSQLQQLLAEWRYTAHVHTCIYI